MKTLIFILFCFCLTNCNRITETDGSTKLASNIDNSLNIYLKDKNGSNLVGTEGYDEKSIKLFYIVDGVKKEVYYPNYDRPRNYAILTDSNGIKYVQLALNVEEKNLSETSTYVQWNSNQTDTLVSLVNRGSSNGGSYIIVEKVYLNDNLVWEEPTLRNTIPRTITIVK